MGSSCLKINGPIQGHRQHLLKQSWAQPKPLAAAVNQLLGPFEIIGSSCQKINEPKRNYWWQLPETWWAHAKASAGWQHLLKKSWAQPKPSAAPVI
jgi:hypothetical protein